MTFTIDPDLIENNDVRLTSDGSGNLVIEHVPSRQTLTLDESANVSDKLESTLTETLDANGNDIQNVSSLEATDVMTAPKYPTRSDVPDKEGIYRVDDVDGEGNFGVIVREI